MTKKQKKVLIRIMISAVLVVVFGLLPVEDGYLRLALFLVPYLIIGYDILRKAVLGIFNGQVFDENFLMALATVGAIILGEYTEGTAVMLFYQIGELFQGYAVGKSRRNISALMDIRPDYANIEQDGELEQIDPDDVEIGTIIVVQPGEKVPIDGVVVSGSSTLNTSALTGESLPREVGEGDDVISGCVNLSGLLRIETTKEFGESTVSKILDLVENSSMKKSKSENFITRFARYYTPAVCLGALALAILPPLANMVMGNPANWSQWVIRALTTLVISCPCALVISIPLSFFGGIGGASAQGVLVKGSNYLEALSETKYVVCDKTGTLTKGVFEVTQIEASEGVTADALLEMAAYANAKEAVAGLKAAGVRQVVMLTGDAANVAEAVAAELGVDVVKSELLPADKVAEVERLLAEKGGKERLAFVGDGINDAPVLSRADIGIAMGALGSDAAIEAADIVLMDDDPVKIATAMKISRKTLGIVHQNIVFALAVKFACLALGAVGFVNMWWAIFADVGVMIIAVLNATRTLKS